ncbi:MAG: hypothetical protein A2589_03555 [Candidatus Vogelbacteria bacterium RIFOXYD1_FULL_46_19]|uniref:MurNAc-LAA domain-containing protein n=1 Tax=Candidatus Vogelbacteria bacterium RIFOXYD1_FULL_46_19 TaxID=1802439 RepID=A0A1G2QGQ4_9BACT|nr:MAG: hypothetical protein A2589_03555 [Candidatus Vogelbacteria bacterium RIFOXYD1_FULL_46_19]
MIITKSHLISGGIVMVIVVLLVTWWYWSSNHRSRLPVPVATTDQIAWPDQTVVSAEFDFTAKPYKILLVPGHDLVSRGGFFKELTEEQVARELARVIAKELKADGRFEVITTRDYDTGEYTEEFQQYFSSAEVQILSFRRTVRQAMDQLLKTGAITATEPAVDHNYAPNQTAFILYGINKWANDNEVDLALHLHFNDYPRELKDHIGKYQGFAIYIPERQFTNATSSKIAGDSLAAALGRVSPPSNFPLEADVIIETQDLIAVGSHNSQTHPALLVEYGYIYESKYYLLARREKFLPILAEATYRGLVDYFSKSK